uniref:Ovule protein n=1 Tax=Ascaris lumbricoides TaxID=6252 RepID=A0A0M3HT00_ASCLU
MGIYNFCIYLARYVKIMNVSYMRTSVCVYLRGCLYPSGSSFQLSLRLTQINVTKISQCNFRCRMDSVGTFNLIQLVMTKNPMSMKFVAIGLK